MNKSTDPKDYIIPYGSINECGEIITNNKGITYHGCPGCGACFVWDCFCGFATEKSDEIDDDYLYSDEFHNK